MVLEEARKALLDLRATLNEQETKSNAETPLSELDHREKKKLIEDGRVVLVALEEFFNKILLAHASSNLKFSTTVAATDMTLLLHDFCGIIHSIRTTITSADYQMVRNQLLASQLKVAQLELEVVKLNSEITVIRDELGEVKESDTKRKEAEAQARSFAALNEVVALCEESIWREGRSREVTTGSKRSLVAIGRDQKLETMKILSAKLLNVDMDELENVIDVSETIKDACRPYGYVSIDEIKWNKQKLLDCANNHLPSDVIFEFKIMLDYLSRTCSDPQYADQPLLATYLTIRKKFPDPLV